MKESTTESIFREFIAEANPKCVNPAFVIWMLHIVESCRLAKVTINPEWLRAAGCMSGDHQPTIYSLHPITCRPELIRSDESLIVSDAEWANLAQ